MRNLFILFKTGLSKQFRGDILASSGLAMLAKEEAEAADAEDKVGEMTLKFGLDLASSQKQSKIIDLMKIEDGCVDLVILLGFDQDIYESKPYFRSGSYDEGNANRHHSVKLPFLQ